MEILDGTEKKVSTFTKAIGWFTKGITNAQWQKILKVYFVCLAFFTTGLALYVGYKAASNDEIINNAIMAAMKKSNDEHKEAEKVRGDIVTPRIQHDLKVLTYTLNADRAFLFELHNGKVSSGGIPFRFATMSYEAVNENKKVGKVALSFQELPLSLYKYPYYLKKNILMMGTVDEIREIDEDFANHIEEVGGKFLGMIYISNDGKPLGFLCVSYHSLEDMPDKSEIEKQLREHERALSQLLDIKTYIE